MMEMKKKKRIPKTNLLKVNGFHAWRCWGLISIFYQQRRHFHSTAADAPALSVLQHRARALYVGLPPMLAVVLWQNSVRSRRPQRNHSSAFLPLCTRKGWLNACNFPPSALGALFSNSQENRSRKLLLHSTGTAELLTNRSHCSLFHLVPTPASPLL